MIMAKIKVFEEYTDRYDQWFEKNSQIYAVELEAIRQVIPPNALKSLEIGVGTGKFAQPLGITLGVEPSEKMAQKAEQIGIQVIRAVAENLPFGDQEFDFVLMVTTICFVDDIVQSFSEAFRVLKPHGYLIIGFIDRESPLGQEYSHHRNRSVFYQDATFFSVEEINNYLTQVGFTDLIFKQTLIPQQPLNLINNGFGEGSFVVIRAFKNS